MGYLDIEEGASERRDEDILATSLLRPSEFALLVRKYEEPFLRKAQNIIKDAQAAEDIVQETFTKIYLNAPKFRAVEGATFSSWGYRILINTALTRYARQKRERGSRADLDEEIWALIPDKNLRQFEKKTLEDEVASILNKIPAPLAAALASFFIDGKSQEEMAAEEGVSVGAIKSRVHRAKAEFRKVYKKMSETIGQSASL
jgi:RNA polymerase sigma factor (sigma-70 family)